MVPGARGTPSVPLTLSSVASCWHFQTEADMEGQPKGMTGHSVLVPCESHIQQGWALGARGRALPGWVQHNPRGASGSGDKGISEPPGKRQESGHCGQGRNTRQQLSGDHHAFVLTGGWQAVQAADPLLKEGARTF